MTGLNRVTVELYCLLLDRNSLTKHKLKANAEKIETKQGALLTIK